METENIRLTDLNITYLFQKKNKNKILSGIVAIIITILIILVYLIIYFLFKRLKTEYSNKISEIREQYSDKLSGIKDEFYHHISDIKIEYSHKLSKIIDKYSQNLSKLTKIYYHNLSTIQKENYHNLLLVKRNNSDRIKFYKKLLQLYIENRTEFYIRGRQKMMDYCSSKYNDSNIITIQDKYNWLAVHDNPELKSRYTDKILLHKFSIEILGKDICVPIIKIYKNADEIDLRELPDKFVLKCNHGSGMNIICINKTTFNLTKSKKLLNHWMDINYGLQNFEYQYINIEKKIFAEKYLCDNIVNYKFYCFNGNPKIIRAQIHLKNKTINRFYNIDWTLSEIVLSKNISFKNPEIEFKKPKNLNLMIDYAKKFSSIFIFVRVDLYDINDTVYLGELTFTPTNAFRPYKDRNQSIYLGSLMDITKVK